MEKITGIEIKKAVEQDILALTAIESQHSTSAGWGKKGIEIELKQKNALVVKAILKNEIVGFISGKIIPPELQIINLAVDKKYLKQSIASQLIEFLISASKKENCAVTTLEVNETNKAASNLYSKIGFKVVGKRPKFYNNLHTAILMDKH